MVEIPPAQPPSSTKTSPSTGSIQHETRAPLIAAHDNQGTITLEAHTTKSRRKRVVPLPSTVLPVLREWKPEGAAADDLVVASPVTGERLTNVKRGWAALLKDAQITGFRWHDMRHDYASRLVQAGADIFRVSRLLGHADPSLTAKRYAALAPDHLRDVVELLA